MAIESAVKAVDFRSRNVYQSRQRPGYTSWVSFFPGEKGQWYLTCEEVTLPSKPLPKCTLKQWCEMGLPVGCDKSEYLMEAVILESTDNMETWRDISRQPYRQQHTVGQFGTARTKDGRFLRFIWAGYSLDESVKPNEIFSESSDNGETWNKMPPFHDRRFVSYPHRLRMLRDGALVLCVPLSMRWGVPERPGRHCQNLNAIGDKQMTLFFSFDQGRTWEGPLPIYGGQDVSETDFVELSSGDLLFVNNSIFANPGRQFIYREGRKFTPGLLEKAMGKTRTRDINMVPETVCITENEILVGCLRGGFYQWSDDLGLNWQRLEGIPVMGPEVYQPWIYYLGDGRIACAGHFGCDDPINVENRRDQYLNIHTFSLEVLRKTEKTMILLERDFNFSANRFFNSYSLTLLCNGQPLPGKELEFWYVGRDEPGYESFGNHTLEERMAMGGDLISGRTGADGKAHIDLSHLDAVEDVHHSIQLIARFNADGADSGHQPCQTCMFEFYSIWYQDPPLGQE